MTADNNNNSNGNKSNTCIMLTCQSNGEIECIFSAYELEKQYSAQRDYREWHKKR